MISTRKRKMMINKLNKFFELHGRIMTEAEYMAQPSVPYRIGIIKKYLRSWSGMVAYLNAYYPKWKKQKPKPKPKVVKKEEAAPLKAFYSKEVKDKEKIDEDE